MTDDWDDMAGWQQLAAKLADTGLSDERAVEWVQDVLAAERERIAAAIESERDALTSRINDRSDPYWSADQVDQWTSERIGLNRAARIARIGA